MREGERKRQRQRKTEVGRGRRKRSARALAREKEGGEREMLPNSNVSSRNRAHWVAEEEPAEGQGAGGHPLHQRVGCHSGQCSADRRVSL
jgi:hypothetical protein